MADKNYKKDLDKLFAPGGAVPDRFKGLMGKLKDEVPVDEVRDAALKAMHDAEDFRAFAAAAREFRKAKHALPDDEDMLIRMLDLPDERAVQDVLQHILDLDRRRGFDRKRPLRNRIETIRSIAEDPKTETLLAKIAEIV